jgi:hypothetical protein
MALTILTGSSQAAGINYFYRTSGSADWVSVPTSSYFYDIIDKLPRFKASNGDIQNIITFPFTGSALITGSLGVTGSINGLILGLGSSSIATNIAIGASTLGFNTTGNNNVALGQNALRSNTTGTNNVALGQRALYQNTTGIYNTAIGQNTLQQNTTGTNNIALGRYSLRQNITGAYNTAIGLLSLNNNISGNSNS